MLLTVQKTPIVMNSSKKQTVFNHPKRLLNQKVKSIKTVFSYIQPSRKQKNYDDDDSIVDEDKFFNKDVYRPNIDMITKTIT